MEYVYYMVPKKMAGQQLIPLNQLKESEPELYAEAIQKYNDHPERLKLLVKRIPQLECLWNDVLHFLPIHPSHVYEGLRSLGIKVKTDLLFYEIPVDRLSGNQTVIYHYRKEHYKGPAAPIDPIEIEVFDPVDNKIPNRLPEETFDYFQEEHAKGNQFGMFPYIPHILSLGAVDISGVRIVNWSKSSLQEEEESQ